MLEKIEILVVIFILLLTFYLVILLGASKRKKARSPEISSYLFGVRILIIFIGMVSLILWFFL